jgi:hypothetical protein
VFCERRSSWKYLCLHPQQWENDLAMAVENFKDDAANHAIIKLLDDIGDGALDAIIASGTLYDCIEDHESPQTIRSHHMVWLFSDVSGHQVLHRISVKYSISME